MAAWRSGNIVGRINEVTLRRARLVLEWVTCPGSTPGGGTLFRYVTSQPRPTQPFIISGSINWVVSNFIGACSRGSAGAVDSIAVRRVWQQFSRLNPSVYSAALRGGCCVPPYTWRMLVLLIARNVWYLINEHYYYYYVFWTVLTCNLMMRQTFSKRTTETDENQQLHCSSSVTLSRSFCWENSRVMLDVIINLKTLRLQYDTIRYIY